MSTLRSGLEEMQQEELRYARDEDLEADLLEIERTGGALEVERARREAEIRERGSYKTVASVGGSLSGAPPEDQGPFSG